MYMYIVCAATTTDGPIFYVLYDVDVSVRVSRRDDGTTARARLRHRIQGDSRHQS
jgi:hypothetical protein